MWICRDKTMILCKAHFFFLLIISCGKSSPLLDNGVVAPTPNASFTNESDDVNQITFSSEKIHPSIILRQEQEQSNKIKVDSSPPSSTEEKIFYKISDRFSQDLYGRSQKTSSLLTEFRSEIRRNKFLVASTVLKKVEDKLTRLRSQLSQLLVQKCPRPKNPDEENDPMTSSLTCKEGQRLVEKKILALETLVNVNKKYRIDSDSIYDHVETESRKIQDSFKSVLKFFPDDHFDAPDDLEASASELVMVMAGPQVSTDPNNDRQWIPVREKFQKIQSIPELMEELVDEEVEEENLNGNSEIFKLASLIKNSRNAEDLVHLKSKFPILVQRVIWDRKCQLKIKTTEGTEFKLIGGKNLTVTSNEIDKRFPYRHQVAQSWTFIPVEGADFFILENIFRKTLVGASPESTVAVKTMADGQDYTMTPPEFLWRLELGCKMTQGLQQEIVRDSKTAVTQTDVALSLPLPPVAVTEGTTMAMNSLDLTDPDDDKEEEEEDCSQDSLFMKLQNKEFPHLALNVNAKGKVVLTEDPGRFLVA